MRWDETNGFFYGHFSLMIFYFDRSSIKNGLKRNHHSYIPSFITGPQFKKKNSGLEVGSWQLLWWQLLLPLLPLLLWLFLGGVWVFTCFSYITFLPLIKASKIIPSGSYNLTLHKKPLTLDNFYTRDHQGA